LLDKEKPVTLYELTHPVVFQRPARWQVHLRYAMPFPDSGSVSLPAGTWLLALTEPTEEAGEYHYRCTDGAVVARAEPLTAAEAIPVTNPEAMRAMAAYRPFEQMAREDWGVNVEHVSPYAPFRLIKCPLCSGTEFTTLDLAETWCDRCNANFSVRHTAGDPGFVVDCRWPHYYANQAHYCLPCTDDLLVTLVFKNSGDPLNLAHSRHCHRDDCTAERVALTGAADSLRPGLHACEVGDVYNWSFYGHAPAQYSRRRHDYTPLTWPEGCSEKSEDGHQEAWPASVFVGVSGLSHDEEADLRRLGRMLSEQKDDLHPNYRRGLLETLHAVVERPRRPPYLPFRSPFPRPDRLQAGEKFLLHRWLLKPEPGYGEVIAYPIWLVVTAVESRSEYDLPGWRVVRDNLCPYCGQGVTPEQVADTSRWGPHHACRELWRLAGWRPLVPFDDKPTEGVIPEPECRR
jgi:hypothetical protein